MGAGLGALAGALRGGEKWTDQERKHEMKQEMEAFRRDRLEEYENYKANRDRTWKKQDQSEQREYDAGLLSEERSYTEEQDKVKHKRDMEKVGAQKQYDKYKAKTTKYDEEGNITSSQEYVDVSKEKYNSGPGQQISSSLPPNEQINQIKKMYKDKKITREEASSRIEAIRNGAR